MAIKETGRHMSTPTHGSIKRGQVVLSAPRKSVQDRRRTLRLRFCFSDRSTFNLIRHPY